MKRFVFSALAIAALGLSGCGADAGVDCEPAAERCDGIDNDCDDRIDEDAVDMNPYYADNDRDGYGGDVVLLACEAPAGYSDNSRDCNDEDENYHPGAEESCDDPNDYNCDGSTQYADADMDGVPACNDCDDNNADVNPNATEVCNGIDDNCSGGTDDASLADMCGDGSNGRVGCRGALGCKLLDCEAGYFDLDGDPGNGCECLDLVPSGAGTSCSNAIDLGSIGDTAQFMDSMWNVARLNGEVWYRFRAVDQADTSCDNFHVDVRFASNPNDEFLFDVRRGGCGSPSQNDMGLTHYSWYTDFRATVMGRLSGECPCTAPGATPVGNQSQCTNSTTNYYVRVYRNPAAAPTCTTFGIANSNGVYDSM